MKHWRTSNCTPEKLPMLVGFHAKSRQFSGIFPTEGNPKVPSSPSIEQARDEMPQSAAALRFRCNDILEKPMLKRSCSLVVLFLLAIGSLTISNHGVADAQVDTKHCVAFGDSLTDNDDVYLYFGTLPILYQEDPFEATFLKAKSQGDALTKFAVLGSKSSDVLTQVQYFSSLRRKGLIAPATLISLEAGGNDFLDVNNLLTLASAAPGESELVDGLIDDIRFNLLRSIQTIRQTERAPIVLWTIPNLTFVPYTYNPAFDLDATELQNLDLHAREINQFIRALCQRRGLILMDMAKVLEESTYVPPVIAGTTILPAPFYGQQAMIFADPIHPTAVANGILANEMIDSLNQNLGDDIPLYSEAELATKAGL